MSTRRNLILGVLAASWLVGPVSLARAEKVSFVASVDQSEVALDEQLVLTLSVTAQGSVADRDVKLGSTGSLEVISTSKQKNVAFSFSGGGQQYTQIMKFVYVLQPKKLGKTRIGAARLRHQGKIYKTEPIDIRVVKEGKGRPKPGRTSPLGPRMRTSPFGFDDDWPSPFSMRDRREREEIDENDIFVSASVSPDLVVEGQQVSVTVTIFSRVGARIASIRWPKLDGFFSVDRDVTKAKTDQKYIHGELYQYKVLDQKALFPLRPGEIEIGPVDVEVEASSSPFFPSQVRKLRTRPLKVKVLAVPQEGKPASFQAANVGRFTLTATLDANEVKLNQPVTYTLSLRGTGSMQRVRPPELPELPRFKVFDPTVEVKVSKFGKEVTGSKNFEYILVPLASGSLTIPALEFAYYDPRRGEYVVLKTQEEVIQVAASAESGTVDGVAGGHEVNILAGSFKPIRYESSLRGYGPPFYKHALFVPLLIVPPALYLLLLMVMVVRARGRVDSARNRMRKAWTRGQRRLKKAGQLAATGNTTDFYAELKSALLDGIEARTGLFAQGITLAEIVRHLEQAGTSPQVTDAIAAESENCDFGRFAPATTQGDQMQASLERVRKVIKDLERERIRPIVEVR